MLRTCESAALIHIHQDGCAHVRLVAAQTDPHGATLANSLMFHL